MFYLIHVTQKKVGKLRSSIFSNFFLLLSTHVIQINSKNSLQGWKILYKIYECLDGQFAIKKFKIFYVKIIKHLHEVLLQEENSAL